MAKTVEDEYKNRLKKLKKIYESGVNPYPASFKKKQTVSEVRQLKLGTKNVVTAGRIVLLRKMGKLTFAHIADGSGKIQIVLEKDRVGQSAYKTLTKLIDPGDFVGAAGTTFKTKKGEFSLKVSKLTLLTKTLRPLPEKWQGLKDQEVRFRRRYLDLISNEKIRELFVTRAKLIANFRSFLDKNDFLEVETPVLEHIPGGADAEPFTTHHNTLDIDLYLRISLELHLKRLIVGGYDRVYEIGKVFRNEGMSTQHLQEFTMLEFYWAYADYRDLMKFAEKLFTNVIKNTFGTLVFVFEDKKINFKAPWKSIDYTETLSKKLKLDILTANESQLMNLIKNNNIKTEKGIGRGRMLDLLYKKFIRPEIIQPTFLINHPLEVSPLAKKTTDNPNVTERMQLIVAGNELINAYSELNNPVDQQQRFKQQMKLREKGDKEAQMMDEDFVTALEHGMPPTGGFGVGIDRLLMILTNQSTIREVVLFPTMRPKE